MFSSLHPSIKEEFKNNTASDTAALDKALAAMKESYDSDSQIGRAHV